MSSKIIIIIDRKVVGNSFIIWIGNFIRIIEFDNFKSASRAKRLLDGTRLNGREIFAQFV